MLATTFTLFALVASATNATVLSYQNDYAKGYSQAVEANRPIALFFGEGKTGPAQVVTSGLSAESVKLLNESYVAIYVDTTSDSGKKLAASYGVSTGLVISDRSGSKQALRLNGTVAADDLQTSLVKFADPNVVITTTQTTARPVAVPVYSPSPCASGRCPNAPR